MTKYRTNVYNLLLFFPSLYNHLKPFLIFQPPFILTPRSLNLGVFSNPLSIGTPHLFGTWEYVPALIYVNIVDFLTLDLKNLTMS